MNSSHIGKTAKPARKGAFTLIELLIVVAIIAILAAIAVPNFLEAQVRAKVSRAKSDMRSMATALETYYVDNNAYPDFFTILGGVFLTTPVAYITAIPEDVFRISDNTNTTFPFNLKWYRYAAMPLDNATRWIIESTGPDTDMDTYISTGGGPMQPDITAMAFYPGYNPELFAEPGLTVNTAVLRYDIYDPTNGTISSGDIFRANDHIFQ